MVTKKELIDNELFKEIFSIRLDTLWKMLRKYCKGSIPRVDQEGATGEFDNKGAIFIPGGFIPRDSDGNDVEYETYGGLQTKDFIKSIRNSMRFDNATLLFPNGVASGVNLDNGFFARMATRILNYKKSALARRLGENPPINPNSANIARSHCPVYMSGPYGSRTKISSCVAACFNEPHLYYSQSRDRYKLRANEAEELWTGIKESREPIYGENETVLAQPHIVVCHDTRYREECFTGLTRILGYGKFGEFTTFTLEEATADLLEDASPERSDYTDDEIVAQLNGTKVAAVLRMYEKTINPGKRPAKREVKLISPEKEMNLDIKKLERKAKKRYTVD